MEDKIKEIMASVFEINAADINDSTTTETVEQWDSLQHINLVVALEDEFGAEFDSGEISGMISYEKILSTIKEKAAS